MSRHSQTGVIQKVNSRKFGRTTFYSMALDGVDGWFSFGPHAFDESVVFEGNSVSFEYEINDKGYNDIIKDSVKPTTAAGPGKSKAVAAPVGDSRQVSIMSQTALKEAVQVVLSGVNSDHIKVPKTAVFTDTVAEMVLELQAKFTGELLTYGTLTSEEALEYIAMQYGGGGVQDVGMPEEDVVEGGMA